MDGQWTVAGVPGGAMAMQSGAMGGTYAVGGGPVAYTTGGMMQPGGQQVVGMVPVQQMGAVGTQVCGDAYGGMAGGAVVCGGGTAESNVFVEVTPEVQPTFNHTPNGAFVMEVPPVVVRLSTSCQPPPPAMPGLVPFKPYEEFMVQFPELAQVVFDPRTQSPPGLGVTACTTKRGAVLEVPVQVGLNSQLKANSPHGTLVLEDLQVTNGYKQKIGENMLHYTLKVEGQLSMDKNSCSPGAHRLEVDLAFTLTCQFEAGQYTAPVAPAMQAYGGGAVMSPTMMVQQPQQQCGSGIVIQGAGGHAMAGGQVNGGIIVNRPPQGYSMGGYGGWLCCCARDRPGPRQPGKYW